MKKNARITTAARMGTEPRCNSSTTYSAMTTALAAPENARVTSSSDQPARNPMVGPQASWAYTYLPPARGRAAAISASVSVLSATTTPPSTHIPSMLHALPR
ncbi:MAG: hypothetical protein P8Z36_06840 [Gemmatimonadota bacterium]